jgi:light-regulated signal transduction histidine kinase (bacteriophytochrome)
VSNAHRPRISHALTPEEKALVVIALEHDARQPQHSIEMALRTLRLVAMDLEVWRSDEAKVASLLARMRSELASVNAATRQIIDTQQDLIDAIRLEFDTTPPLKQEVRAEDILDHVWRASRALAEGMELRCARTRLIFVSDERLVQRMICNLVANAIWHSQGTKILVCAYRRGSDIVFEVRDNGVGMPAQKVRNVFEPIKAPTLSRVGFSSSRSGLGLYNVRLIAARLGGSVECFSEVYRGTRFRVRLPGPVELADANWKAVAPIATATLRSKLVAILDEDLTALRSLERAFQSLGVEVYADHDPIRWLSVITDLDRMPDLMLLDIQLGQQGCALQLEVVRRRWHEQRPKVVLISGHPVPVGFGVPTLQKPIPESKFEVLIDVLSGRHVLPAEGPI